MISIFIEIILIIVLAIVGVYLITRGTTSSPNGIVLLIVGAIFLLVALYVALVTVGLA